MRLVPLLDYEWWEDFTLPLVFVPRCQNPHLVLMEGGPKFHIRRTVVERSMRGRTSVAAQLSARLRKTDVAPGYVRQTIMGTIHPTQWRLLQDGMER